MTKKTHTSRILFTIGTIVCCALPWLVQPAAANNTASALGAATSGIAAWYQNRQRNLSTYGRDLEHLQRQADAGDAEAQYQLGMIYQGGRGVERNIPLARQLFEHAAQAGDAYGQYALALLLREQGGQAEWQRSVQLQEQAAISGHPEAQYGLGLLYANGQYVARDIYKARHWLQQAKLRGNEMAQLALRDLPAQGAAGPRVQPGARYQAPPARQVTHQAVHPSINTAPAMAARPLTPPPAMNQVAARPQQRPAPVTRPAIQATPVVMNPVPTEAGLAALPADKLPEEKLVADNQAGRSNIAVEHHESAVNLDGMSVNQIRTAAQRGDRYAQLMLGALYEDGSDGVQQSYATALSWYLKSARQGYPKAQHNLALLYEDGRGTQQNYQQAAIWYKKAAQAGFSEAQNNLAVLYILGKGVEEDRDYAEQLLRQAVAKGNANAERNLEMLLSGAG